MKSTPYENLEKSEHDFTITLSEKTPLASSTQNILTKMNIMPQYVAYVFYLLSSEQSKKFYKPCVITEGRTITDKVHRELYMKKKKLRPEKKKKTKAEKDQERKNRRLSYLKGRTKN